MNINDLPPGPKGKIPNEIYVITEIPKGSHIKYELDEKTGFVFVDRFLYAFLEYPGDYGTIPQTLSGDGDCLDAIVLVSSPTAPRTIIPARPVGLLAMEDESGRDVKIIAVPTDMVDPRFHEIKDIKDVPKHILKEIRYFYEHYKELETEKWVKVKGFENKNSAKKEIKKALKKFREEVK